MKDKIIKNIKATSRGRWIKFGLVALIIIGFVVWMSNPWLLLLLLLDFDIYASRIIPWTWWKDIRNEKLRRVMEWVDAIVFALIAVYIINLYFFQNYKIPSSSMEKTLLVGDHLFVSKLAYGPRTPETPLSFPLVQHTFPILDTKSYIDGVKWNSRRLKGFGGVKRYDIVVFNFPGGDTVAEKMQTVDYEQLCYDEGLRAMEAQGVSPDSVKASGMDLRHICISIGREKVANDKENYGRILYRPTDRRENYIKRCVGLPGDVLEVRDRELYINGRKQARREWQQQYCEVRVTRRLDDNDYDELELSRENTDRAYVGQDDKGQHVYLLPLSQGDQKRMKKVSGVTAVAEHNISEISNGRTNTFPVGYNLEWDVDNYGPIYIPKKGATVKIDKDNIALFERVIRNYEHNKLDIAEDGIYINGKKADEYTFKMDYYWMMGDNRHNSADSRIWGYVPEDHVVGKPVTVWLSLNPDKGWLNGKIRWSRFFYSE